MSTFRQGRLVFHAGRTLEKGKNPLEGILVYLARIGFRRLVDEVVLLGIELRLHAEKNVLEVLGVGGALLRVGAQKLKRDVAGDRLKLSATRRPP